MDRQRRRFRSVREFLDQNRLLADPAAKVVQFGTTHLTALHDLDLGDLRRVHLEYALHALTIGDFPNGECLIEAGAAAGDDDALEDLNTLLAALNHSSVNIDGVTGTEFRDILLHLFAFDFFDHIHGRGKVREIGGA